MFVCKFLEQGYSLPQSYSSNKINVLAKELEERLSSGASAIEKKSWNKSILRMVNLATSGTK